MTKPKLCNSLPFCLNQTHPPLLYMDTFSFLFFCLYFCMLLLVCMRVSSPVSSAPVRFHSIFPNFTASHFEFIDSKGVFLESINGTFTASIANSIQQTSQYYFSVIHTFTSKVIWSANRNSPISSSAHLYLNKTGLSIVDESNRKIWSTPELASKVSVMWLLETGNLILADERNNSLWESFDYPTDTLVMGQRLSVGKSLDAAASDFNLSVGEHSLSVTDHDAILQWEGMKYWKLSMDTRAFKDTNAQVSFMVMNQTGLYLYGTNGTTVVMQVGLVPSDFKIAKMGFDGKFVILAFGGTRSSSTTEFSTPLEACSTPFVCGKLGLCSDSGVCSCVPGFHSEPRTKGTCVPSNIALSLPSACNTNKIDIEKVSSRVSYNTLNPGLDYFATDFIDPVENGANFSSCANLCTNDCSCLGFFYRNSSGSCYLLKNQIGSMRLRSNSGHGFVGSVKVLISPVQTSQTKKKSFPLVGFILIPFSVSTILVAMAIFLLRRRKMCNGLKNRLGRSDSSSSSELELIPGLPVRFDYEAIAAATDNFQTQIGCGGFGTVYKGTLPDKTLVAVKSITSFGTRGKKGFGTEIAVIANIHHVNLVKLKGFCAQGRHRFLVLEYMDRGSLDHVLFDAGPVLEWHERFEIALGTARGLAYLHSGCGHKIIHCDIKPENILLHDKLQAKISDFGLSKLLGPEQSFLFTTLRGTRGYLAPEWLTRSSITDKTDVYSYGMVLLEIVSGRKNSSWQARSTNSRSDNDEGNNACSSSTASEQRRVYFPLLALKMHQRLKYLELADPRLEGRVTSDEVEKLVRVALNCLHEEPTLRPTMENIVAMLEGRLPLGEPRIDSLNFLRFYGERFTEPSTVEASSESNPLVLSSQQGGVNNGNMTTNDRHSHFSCISSQQLSGPR